MLAVRNTQFAQAGMLLALANEALAAESAESEVAYRALMAAGNTVCLVWRGRKSTDHAAERASRRGAAVERQVADA